MSLETGRRAPAKSLHGHRGIFRAVALGMALLGSGCAMMGLRQDLAQMEQSVEIRGSVTGSSATTSPVFVALYRETAGKLALQTYWMTYDAGDFQFFVPSGDYYVFAFEDRNENAAYEREERVGWYGAPSLLRLDSGSKVEGVKLALRMPETARADLPQLYLSSAPSVPMDSSARQLGTVVSLDDGRFGEEYARRGLWEPVKFLEEPGGGLFFLEPYDPARIPVLFVHGAGGFPQQWSAMIESLDRTHFQPWVLQYPSGFRLDLIGTALAKYLHELQVKHGFDRICIVAHSMGGLVARSAINHGTANGSPLLVRLLITLATPWQGHRAAMQGVERSPFVIPSWYDMSPGSPFLRELAATPLPPCTEFVLLFGYRGASHGNGDLSDGSIFLSSVLDGGMQGAASVVRGFDADHVSILQNSDAILTVNELLRKCAEDGARGDDSLPMPAPTTGETPRFASSGTNDSGAGRATLAAEAGIQSNRLMAADLEVLK